MTSRAVIAAGCCSLAIGCAFLVDTSDLTGPTSPATSNDGSSDVASSEGGSPTGDGGVGIEAGVDGAPAVRFCRSQTVAPFFCQDFEDGNLTGAFRLGAPTSVSPPVVVGTGNAALSSIAASGRYAFGSSLAASPDSVEDGARYESPVFLLDVKRVRLSFALRMGLVESGGALCFIFVRASDFTIRMLSQIYAFQPGEAHLGFEGRTDGGAFIEEPFTTPADNAWARYELTVDMPRGQATVSLDGKVVATTTIATSLALGERVDFALGLTRNESGGAREAIYDDIIFESLDP